MANSNQIYLEMIAKLAEILAELDACKMGMAAVHVAAAIDVLKKHENIAEGPDIL